MTVPLDHAGLHPGPHRDGQLALQVAMTDNAAAPRGVLVFLTGGPGQPGLPFASSVANLMFEPPVVRDYRLIFIDQRGTGAGALQCPQLQEVMGSSDLTVPPAGVVGACAQAIGPDRQFFTTEDTVADLDALRQALGVEKLTIDGVSYGTFVAARYAVIHPDRVSRLVLDSVVPHDNLDPLELASLSRTAEVLRMVCQENGCPTDPAQELSTVVQARHDGPELLDTLTALTIGTPNLADVPAALHAAVRGDHSPLDAIVAAEHRDQAATADELSQGLHASTLCEDLRGPWGDAATPVPSREAATQRAVAALPDAAFFPYDRTTAASNGIAVTCEQWPSTPVVAFPAGRDLPAVPVLLLAGDHDLSTPLPWAQQETAHAPRGRLVIIPGAGHSTQSSSLMARSTATAFLTQS
ncbi:MAG: alpha/beta fold hydrolase [Pseudonocardiales bacterium]|nr:alpha/beta fold hydrolase [Pseudonocardiales bacterium]MBV9649771.1 alpha/beta fold hydrolase [Pseudonocardiales bacterium]